MGCLVERKSVVKRKGAQAMGIAAACEGKPTLNSEEVSFGAMW